MFRRYFQIVYQKFRILSFKLLSTNRNISGKPIVNQPVLFLGTGTIIFEGQTSLGYFPSPFFFQGAVHLEARKGTATIKFGDKVFANNNLCIICERTSVEIGNNVLIGTNVEIMDSDFHGLYPGKRNQYECMPVNIGDNVFIGSNVKIMKGVTIGENSTIANGSIVTKSFPANSVIGGNPGKVLKVLEL